MFQTKAKYLGDAFGLITGYTLAKPDSHLLSTVHESVNNAWWLPSPTVVDEITRAVAGLILTIASRVIFDMWAKYKQEKKNEEK